MNTSTLIFSNDKFGEMRTFTDSSQKTWFCLADLCKMLDIGNSSQLKTRLNPDGVITNEVMDSMNRLQPATFIGESNLYKVIFQSRKAEAEAFTEWVTSEVLPCIRKHGAYATPQTIEDLIADPANAIKLLTALENERIRNMQLQTENNVNKERLQLQHNVIQQSAPKVEYYDTVLQSDSAIAITVIANELGVSAQYLNKMLVAKQVIRKVDGVYVLFAKYQGLGYGKPRTFHYTKSNGEVGTKVELYYSEKGRQFIHGLFKNQEAYK